MGKPSVVYRKVADNNNGRRYTQGIACMSTFSPYLETTSKQTNTIVNHVLSGAKTSNHAIFSWLEMSHVSFYLIKMMYLINIILFIFHAVSFQPSDIITAVPFCSVEHKVFKVFL